MIFKLKKFRKVILIFLMLAILGRLSYVTLYDVLFPKRYSDIVEKYSTVYNLDSNFVYAVIKAESNFETEAKSHKEAKGLMQITDDTGEWIASKIGIDNFEIVMLHDPETNIQMGCWYLDNLIERYENYDTALAAYNAGSGNVDKWLKRNGNNSNELDKEMIPFPETKKYIERVNQYYDIYNFIYK